MTQDATNIETDTEQKIMQLQIHSLRRFAERLRNELDEVTKDRDAWRSRATKTAVAKSARWLRRLVG